MQDTADKSEQLEKLREKIKDVRVAMLTTREEDGTLRSRPMGTIEVEGSDDIWFFLADDSPKAEEVEEDQHVNLSYAAPDKNLYVSVSGRGRIVHDKAKQKELWNPIVKAWFPDGLEDPHLALLQVSIDQAEYWDAPSNKMVVLVGILKSIATRTTYEAGENEKIEM